MNTWIWYLLVYSFLGYLLEVAYAKIVHGRGSGRKCLLLLPLCPVYGGGAWPLWPSAVPILSPCG